MSSSRTPDPHQLHHSPSTVSILTTSTDPNHLQVPSHDNPPTPPPINIPPCLQNPSPEISDSGLNSAQMLRTSPSPPKNNSPEPLHLPPVFLTKSLPTMTPSLPEPPEIGPPPRTPGTPPPGLSTPSPLNPQSENNADAKTTEPKS
uniref:Uncharacterized protein n=1 Tax=Moniliophthora roreri TaxID=221103 RepID=A0A0W0G5H7_MONRR